MTGRARRDTRRDRDVMAAVSRSALVLRWELGDVYVGEVITPQVGAL